ncbi:MAG: hypothetical protein ACRERC_04970 [Candidatus Binatia bacterium]
MDADIDDVEQAVGQLVDEYRDQCLWFLRRDYYPTGRDEMLRTLAYIEQHADQQGFRRAAEIRQWLLRRSNAASVDS